MNLVEIGRCKVQRLNLINIEAAPSFVKVGWTHSRLTVVRRTATVQ